MLEHDLQEQAATETDRFLSGMDVVKAVTGFIDKEVPGLIHFVNVSGAEVMAKRIEKASFRATRIPMDKLEERNLLDWMEDVRETWEDFLKRG